MDNVAALIALVLIVIGLMVVARLITGSIKLASTKRCPACAERVKIAANVCKHCGKEFA